MLYSGIHIQNKHVILTEQQVSEERLEQRALRTDATRSTDIYRSHLQQAHLSVKNAKSLWDIIHARIQSEKATNRARLGAGSLLDQCVHLGNRAQLGAEFAGESGAGDYSRFSANVLMGMPSIIIGVFAYALVVVPLGRFSGYAGIVALAIIMLPIAARTAEDMLRLVPNTLRV